MRKWSLPAIAGLILTIVGIGLGSDMRRDSSSPGAAQSSGARPSAASARGLAPRLRDGGWEPGLERTCALAFETTLAGEGPAAQLRIAGQWQATVVDGDGAAEHALVRLQLGRPTFAMSGAPAPPEVRDELARAWFVEVGRDGRIEAAWFDRAVGRTSRDMLKTIAAYLQHCAPGECASERVEQDSTGTYRADYGSPAPGEVTRTKARYLSVVTEDGPVASEAVGGPEVRASRAHFELDPEGWPVRVAVDEELVVALPEAEQSLSAVVKLRADCNAGPRRADLVGSFAETRPDLLRIAPLAEPRDERVVTSALDRQELGGATHEGLVDELRVAADEHAEVAVQKRLRALFAVHPDQSVRAAELLRGSTLSMSGKKTVIAALAASGAADAQDVLVDFLSDATVTELRQQTLGSLGLTPNPTVATLDALAGIADAPAEPADRNTALLAFGNAARRAPGGDPTAWLLDRLERATNAQEVAICLRALGNTADPRALPAIAGALRSPDPAVRAAAVSALRLVDEPSVDALVSGVLLGDVHEGVRAEAVFAATFRSLDPLLPALDQALRRDPASRVRKEVVELLARRRGENPACHELLVWAEENDEDDGVRSAAAEALAS